MGLHIRQENENWVVEFKEKWSTFEDKDEAEVTKFLQSNQVSYTVGYIFEGNTYEFNAKIEIKDFKKLLVFVNDFLKLKEKIVRPHTPKEIVAALDGSDLPIFTSGGTLNKDKKPMSTVSGGVSTGKTGLFFRR
jgi:hypothetical protein